MSEVWLNIENLNDLETPGIESLRKKINELEELLNESFSESEKYRP